MTHAEPITFGLKLASFYEEFERNKKRLVDAADEVSTCAISGAMLELLLTLIQELKNTLQKNLD